MNNTVIMSIAGEGVQVPNETGDVLVRYIWLKSELVFESNGKSQEKIHRRAFENSVS